jgi:SnoaL-like domain
MKLFLRLLLLAGLIALAVWGRGALFPNPKKVITTRLVKLADVASFSAREGKIAQVANVERMGAFFTDDVEVVIDAPGVEHRALNGRQELTQVALAARSSINGLKVELPDIVVDLDPDNQSAVANVTLRASISGQSDLIVQELRFHLKKVDGAWLIAHIETVKTLRQ